MNPNQLVRQAEELFRKNRNTENAIAMSKYMRNYFSFFGIKKPVRKEITKPILLLINKNTSEKDVLELVTLLWKKKEREFHYLAIDIINKYKKYLSKDSFNTIEWMLVTNSWWDSVDSLANYAVGPLVANFPELRREMKRFSNDANFWLKRIAIIHQLTYKSKVDEEFLFKVCLQHAHDKEFFIRKAIGWALRQYAKHKPKEVKRFVELNKDKLSPLSVREALKHH